MKVPNLGHDILEDVAAFDADEALVEALVGEGEFVGADSELFEVCDQAGDGLVNLAAFDG
jgi:hypothetical protein